MAATGPIGNGPPALSFSAPTNFDTWVTPKWIAAPPIECAPQSLRQQMALSHSEYRLSAQVIHGAPVVGTAFATSMVPWGVVEREPDSFPHEKLGWHGGQTHSPRYSKWAAERITRTDKQYTGTCKVDLGMLVSATRRPATIRMPTTLRPESQFFTKLRAHEMDHAAFFNDPQRPGAAYVTEQMAVDRIVACTHNGDCVARPRNRPNGQPMALKDILIELLDHRLSLLTNEELGRYYAASVGWKRPEREAYAVSDGMPPRFIHQGCGQY